MPGTSAIPAAPHSSSAQVLTHRHLCQHLPPWLSFGGLRTYPSQVLGCVPLLMGDLQGFPAPPGIPGRLDAGSSPPMMARHITRGLLRGEAGKRIGWGCPNLLLGLPSQPGDAWH